MIEILNFITEPSNTATVTTITSLIIALAAFLSFVSTIWLIHQNRRLLRETSAPYVVGYLFLDDDQPQLMNIYIKNFGKEPAFNVTYRVKGNIPESEDLWSFFKDKTDGSIYTLPPDKSIALGVGVTHSVLGTHSDLFLNIGVQYEDRHGKVFVDEFSAQPGQFLLLSAPESPLEKGWRELEKIRKEFGVFRKDSFGRLLVRVQTEDEADEQINSFRMTGRYRKLPEGQLKSTASWFKRGR